MLLAVMTEMVTEQAENVIMMSDELKGVIITTVVTAIISIIGFLVTFFSLRKSFKDELRKQKSTIALDKMAVMPYEVLTLLDKMMDTNPNRNTEEIKYYKSLMNTIYSYGSQKAISLLSLMQKENYELRLQNVGADRYRMMASYILLATQIKYDVTGVETNPEKWFVMRITDYEENRQLFKNANNKLVNELNLNREFLIK